MSKKKIIFLLSLVLMFFVSVSFFALAADESSVGIPNPITFPSFSALLDAVIDWIINITLLLAPLAIIYGGFLHITSAGSPEKSTKGKMVIFYAVIGLIVVLLAKSLIGIIKGLVVI